MKLLSRNDLSLNGRYPGVVADLEARRLHALRDRRRGRRLRGRADELPGASAAPGASIFYYVFDLLWLDGEDVRDRPLRERKALLRDALTFEDPSG